MSNEETLSVTESLQDLKSIRNITLSHCYLDDLCQLLKDVLPTIKYLNCQSVCIYYKMGMFLEDLSDYRSIHRRQLIMMKFERSFDELEILIKLAPNLKSLTISADDNKDMIDACQ